MSVIPGVVFQGVHNDDPHIVFMYGQYLPQPYGKGDFCKQIR